MVLTEKKLAKIFISILKIKKNYNIGKLRRISEEKWDSLAHVNIIIAMESEFKISCLASEAESITSYKSARMFLEKKLKKVKKR